MALSRDQLPVCTGQDGADPLLSPLPSLGTLGSPYGMSALREQIGQGTGQTGAKPQGGGGSLVGDALGWVNQGVGVAGDGVGAYAGVLKDMASTYGHQLRTATDPEILSNAGRNLRPVAESARSLEGISKVLGPVGVGLDFTSRLASGEDLLHAGAHTAGGWAGASVGAEAGAALGAQLGLLTGPFAEIGVPVGAVIGGIGGGIIGSGLGEKAADGVLWAGNKVGEGAKWAGGQIAEGASWAGNKIADGASWAGNKVSDGASWAGDKISSGASWAADKLTSW